MSLKLMTLGTMASAVRGIVMSALGTGTPLGITLTAGHRLRDYARIAIVGCALDNQVNGEWTITGVAATSGNLVGSTGSIALSGTPVVARVCDQTPFLPNHSAVALIGPAGTGTAPTANIGTIVLEGANSAIFNASGATNNKFQYDNTSGVATDGFKDMLQTGEIAIPAATNAGIAMVEVKLARYMTARCSAWTSGTFLAALMA